MFHDYCVYLYISNTCINAASMHKAQFRLLFKGDGITSAASLRNLPDILSSPADNKGYANNCVGEGLWISKCNFCGGHLGFQDGRHAKSILLYSSPTGQAGHISGCTYIFGVEEKMCPFVNCFALAILKFKMAAILDLIWSLSPQRIVTGKLLQIV